MFSRITIDGHCLFAGDINEWQNNPPSMFADLIRSDVRPEPSLKAVLIALTDAVLVNQDVDIDLRTGPDNWVLTVKKGR